MSETLNFGGGRLLYSTRPAESKINSVTTDQDYGSIGALAANAIVQNGVHRVSFGVQYISGVSSATLRLYLKLGTTKIYENTGTDYPNSVTRSGLFVFEIIGTAAPGAAVTVECDGPIGTLSGGGSAQNNTIVQPPGVGAPTFATNGALDLVLGVAWSATGSTETFTLLSGRVEALN